MSLVEDGKGGPAYLVVHAEDVSERNRAAAALRETEDRFRLMAEGCPTAMWVTNASGGIQFINRKCENAWTIFVIGVD